MRCDSCGVESPLKDSFVRTRLSFKRRSAMLCPACRQKKAEGGELVGFLAFLTSIAGLLAYWMWYKFNSFHDVEENSWNWVNAWLFVFFLYAQLLIHELGHVIAAWLMGFEVTVFRIGRGKLLALRGIGNTAIEIRLYPTYGHVAAVTLNTRAYRIRRLICIAGGPLANVGLIILAIFAGGGWSNLTKPNWRLPAPWSILALTNVIALFSNLRWNNRQSSWGDGSPDGYKIKLLLFKPLEPVADRRRMYFIAKASAMLSLKKPVAAKEMLAKALAEFPENIQFRVQMASARLLNREYPSCREILISLAREHPQQDIYRASLTNGIAWADLLIGTPAMLEEADQTSAEAFLLTPWDFAVQSTRGWALVEKGDFDQGVSLIKRSLGGSLTRQERAFVLCTLAIGECRRGKRDIAMELVKKANRLDPDYEILQRTQIEFSRPNDPKLMPPVCDKIDTLNNASSVDAPADKPVLNE